MPNIAKYFGVNYPIASHPLFSWKFIPVFQIYHPLLSFYMIFQIIVDVLLTYLEKDFDKIHPKVIVNKLDQFAFSSSSTKTFFLSSHRQQFVSNNGFFFKDISTTSGVPQGSNIDPPLFYILSMMSLTTKSLVPNCYLQLI